jgi:hypothetical protein
VLEAAGWSVEPFDLTDGQDLLDEAAVARAVQGCAAVVHAGAVTRQILGWVPSRSWPSGSPSV